MLYLASDICITDYSSVFFDFANLKRPILFYAYDFDEYADEIRGMYMDMEKELPISRFNGNFSSFASAAWP